MFERGQTYSDIFGFIKKSENMLLIHKIFYKIYKTNFKTNTFELNHGFQNILANDVYIKSIITLFIFCES